MTTPLSVPGKTVTFLLTGKKRVGSQSGMDPNTARDEISAVYGLVSSLEKKASAIVG